jgi:MtrB/PioB family decaheme-associated outer membrane protein
LPIAAVGAALVVVAPLAAQDDFELHLEPIAFEVLSTDVDTDSSQFQEYRDLSSGFRLPELVLDGYGAESERHLSIYGENIWREDARLTGDYGVWGSYGVWLDYNKIPHRFGNNGSLLWNSTGPGLWELPDSTQAQLQSQLEAAPSRNFDLVESLLEPYLATADSVDLALQRDRFAGRVDFTPLRTFSWGVDYQHENRNGNRAVGTSFGFNNTQELPEPIDYDTSTYGVDVEWTWNRAGVQAGYKYSEFENANDVMIWDNPFRAFDSTSDNAYLGPTSTTEGPSRGIYDLAPDNEAQTLFVTGRSQIGENWWVNGKISSTALEQNDPLQAYTLNTAIVGIDHSTGATFDATNPANLPVQRGNLEADLLSFDVDAGGDLGEDWKLQLGYDYYDYDASVPRIVFDGYVRTHAVWEEIPRVTVPYNYTKGDLGAKVTWDGLEATRLSFSYHLKEIERDNREVESADENVFRLTWDQDLGPKWDLRAHWENGDREYDGYETEAQEVTFLEPEGINNQPDLRKYLQANRDYDDYRVDVFYYPSDAFVVMFGVMGTDVEYPGPRGGFGLLWSELWTYNFEVSYTPGEDLTFYAFGTLMEGESFQRARQSGGTLSESRDDDWEVRFDEDNDHFGLGLNAGLGERWTVDVALQWSEADGLADITSFPGGMVRFPAEDIPNYDDWELFDVRVDLAYEINDRGRAGVWYWYEDYTLDSFLSTGLPSYIAGLIPLDANFGDYQADIYGVYLSFDF